MTDEIRTLIKGLYEDPEAFLKTPHGIFDGRPPSDLLSTEEGQRELLGFLRGAAQGLYMAPNELDQDFEFYTDADLHVVDDTGTRADHLLDRAIDHLEIKIERLRSLKRPGPEVAAVIERTQQLFGELGVVWLVEYNQALQTTPLDLISQGRADLVLQFLGQIDHGVSV